MNIIGQKVTLRAIELSDCELLRELINDPETEYLIGGASFPVSAEAQRHWLETQQGASDTLRVMIDVDGKAIGTAILSDIDRKNGNAQLHIKLGACKGKGYGTDAVSTLVQYAFRELRLHCIYAQVSAHNIPSQRLFEKCGFTKEGVLRQRLYKRGAYIDVLVYSILGDNHA